jgi:hypothetical protein
MAPFLSHVLIEHWDLQGSIWVLSATAGMLSVSSFFPKQPLDFAQALAVDIDR